MLRVRFNLDTLKCRRKEWEIRVYLKIVELKIDAWNTPNWCFTLTCSHTLDFVRKPELLHIVSKKNQNFIITRDRQNISKSIEKNLGYWKIHTDTQPNWIFLSVRWMDFWISWVLHKVPKKIREVHHHERDRCFKIMELFPPKKNSKKMNENETLVYREKKKQDVFVQ